MLILASGSPRRRDLLTQAGFKFGVQRADIDETPRTGEDAAAYTIRLATEKAEAIAALFPEAIVLGADTTVVCDGELIGKPVDDEDAGRMLRQLANRTHQVITGVAICCGRRTQTAAATTLVTFDDVSEAEIASYIASGEPFDKAGAYGIQGYAARWIPSIHGCYFNVVGLPIALTTAMLHSAGIDAEGA